MKKILLIVLAALAGAFGAGAQNSGADILGALGNFINNATASGSFSVDDLTGTWNYSGPAVSFQSENALQNIGGAAAATALEGQFEPYYRRLGFNRTSLTVDAEHNFTLRLGLVQLKGTVEKDDNGQLQFNFSAFNRIPLGKVAANATKSGKKLNVTFDATRFVNILNRVSGALNNNTLSALTTLLNSYDGVYLGFKLESKD